MDRARLFFGLDPAYRKLDAAEEVSPAETELTGSNCVGNSRATAELAVGGMTCASCAKAVESMLVGLPGVDSAEVALLQERAAVAFDPRCCTPQALVQTVEDAGFEASVVSVSHTSTALDVTLIEVRAW